MNAEELTVQRPDGVSRQRDVALTVEQHGRHIVLRMGEDHRVALRLSYESRDSLIRLLGGTVLTKGQAVVSRS